MKLLGVVLLVGTFFAGCGSGERMTKYVIEGREIPARYYVIGERMAPYTMHEIQVDADTQYLHIILDDPKTPYAPDIRITYNIYSRVFDHVTAVDPEKCREWEMSFDSLFLYKTEVNIKISEDSPNLTAALYFRKFGSNNKYDLGVFYDQKTWAIMAVCCNDMKGEPLCFYPIKSTDSTGCVP